MTEKDATRGLTCPQCGGVVPIPEGQRIVRCPYCDLRSFVHGERGLLRYQVTPQVQRQNAEQALRRFFSSNFAIARDVASRAQLSEAFLVYLPFWAAWGRVAAWAFGEKRVGSSDHTRYEPREVRVVQEMSWNGAACDVGELGVYQILLNDQDLVPYDPEGMHASGMVFEPAGVFGEARQAAQAQFEGQVRRHANLDRLAQLFVRIFRRRYALVYYPLWVLRYIYRGRAFQVVVDADSGQVLFGKAPGNTLFRALALVFGMAAGAFVAVDVSALFLSSGGNHGDSAAGIGLFAFVAGLAIMYAAYRTFRYGEQYEYHRGRASNLLSQPKEILSAGMDGLEIGSIKVKDVEEWINRLS